MPDTAFIYSEKLAAFDYGDDHPFKPIRARNTMEQCNRHGLLYSVGVQRPEPEIAEPALLELFHTREYLDILKRANAGIPDLDMLHVGIGTLDCPVLPGIYDFCLQSVGATMTGLRMILDGSVTRAFNPVGGLHHGEADHAEGFCYVNDVGVAVAHLLALGKRVAFVDIDAHHCNGVQNVFYDNPQVLVISLHEFEKGFYPGSGALDEIGKGAGLGYNVNVPLAAKTDDEVYLHAFSKVVPPLLEAFAPDVVIAEIGADTLISDPLTHLRLTSNGYEAVLKILCDITPNLLAVGGGGYDIFRTSNCWTLAFAAMCELPPEDEYAGLVGGMMFGEEAGGLHDPPILTQGDDKAYAMGVADEAIEYIQKNVFPILGAKLP